MSETHSRPPIWAKSRQRRGAKKYLFGNFTSRHLIPDEHYLNRAGLRGRKLWLCLSLFVFVYLIALAHLTLTCVILGVLRFGAGGPPYFVFQSDGSLVWPQGGNLTAVRLAAPSNVTAYSNQPLGISGDNHNTITLQSSVAGTVVEVPSRVSIDRSSIQFSPKDVLHMISPSTKEPLLSVSSSYLQLPDLPALSANLSTTRLTTNYVRNVNAIQSSGQLSVRGAAGVNIMGRFVDITAFGTTTLRAETEIELEGGSGMMVNTSRLSTVQEGVTPAYHLCSCVDGKLFLVHTNPQGCFAAVGRLGGICS